MENICGGDSAGEVTVDVDVVRIQDLRHIHHRGDGNAALVDALGCDVRMAIDNARDDELSRGIDDLGVFRGIDGLADFGDFAILNKDGTALDGSM